MERLRFPSPTRPRIQKPSAFSGFFSHIRRLPPGDKFIAGFLTAIFLATVIVGLVAVERFFLIKVPAYGGTLTEGVVGSPRFVNPLLALTDADRDLTRLTYAGLMGLSADGSLTPVLAESYSISPEGTVYTFVLRPGVRFSDGSPVTADDVVFTVTKAQDPGLKSPEYANWANIRAEAIDSRTVSFTLPQPYTPFLEDTTLGILPARYWRNIPNDQFPFSPLMERPIAAGPFTVTEVYRDKHGVIKEYELRVSKDYAPGRAYLERIRLKFYSSLGEVASALRRGSIESAYGIAREDSLRAPYARVFGVFYNPAAEPVFVNLEVRHALSVAIDRDRIVTDVLGGYGTPLMGPLPPGSDVSVLELPDPATRTEAARLILDEAGWDFKDGAWVKGETAMPVITIRTSNVPELKTIASLVQADWEALGIKVEVELYEPGSLVQEVIRPRAYDALLFGEVVGRDRDLYAFWHSSQRTAPGLNIAQYADTTVDTLLMRSRAASDPIAAETDLMAASDRIAEAYPAAFTHAPDFLYAVPQDIQGVVLPQITSPSDRFATVAEWHRYKEYVWPFLVGRK